MPPWFAQDLKHRQSSLRRRQEELQQEELDTRRKHERIIEELRGQAAQSEVQVEAERQRQRAMEMELSTLRGRLAHEAKEQGQWEQDCRRREQEEMESLMIELRRLRRLHPEQAARVAAALAAEGGGDGVAQSDLLL